MNLTPSADLSAATWRKSTRSAGGSSNCVEVAHFPNLVAIRDSKDPNGPKIVVSPAGWQSFTASVKAGRPDPA